MIEQQDEVFDILKKGSKKCFRSGTILYDPKEYPEAAWEYQKVKTVIFKPRRTQNNYNVQSYKMDVICDYCSKFTNE